MNKIKSYLGVMLLAGLMLSSPAVADRVRGHVGVGVYLGGPTLRWVYPYPYYPYPYDPYPYDPYYPPLMTAPASPPVYIERGAPDQAEQPEDAGPPFYWYHCDKPEGFYPYVRECPGGWQPVEPTPPSSR